MTRKIAPLTQTRRDFETLVESDRAAAMEYAEQYQKARGTDG